MDLPTRRRKTVPRVPNARARTTSSGLQRIQVSFYANGKRHQPWAPAGLTLTQARKWAQAQQWVAEHPTTPQPEPGVPALTVAQVCAEWLAWYKPTARSRNTLDRYTADVRRITAQLGPRLLAELTTADVEHARNHMLEGTCTGDGADSVAAAALCRAARTGRGYSASTVHKTLGVLQAVCAWAMDEDRAYIAKNPVAKVLKAGRGQAQRADYQPLTTAETKRLMGVFLAHADPADADCPYACMLALALASGLRVTSEWGGAQWGDLDWDRGVYALQRTWDRHHHAFNRQSNGKLVKRLIPLAPQAVDVLRAQWAWQRQQTGSDPQASAFVFTDWQGEIVSSARLAELLTAYSWEAGIGREAGQHLTPHSLRHQAAIEALRAGANPKAVQAMLGHSTIAMTLDLYAAFIPGMAETATAAVGGALFEAARSAEAV